MALTLRKPYRRHGRSDQKAFVSLRFNLLVSSVEVKFKVISHGTALLQPTLNVINRRLLCIHNFNDPQPLLISIKHFENG